MIINNDMNQRIKNNEIVKEWIILLFWKKSSNIAIRENSIDNSNLLILILIYFYQN